MSDDPKRGFKRELYDQFARIGLALSSGPRIELLELLSQTERTVEQLAEETGLSFANVSQHLQVLRRAQMVEVRREGLYAFYRLADENVFRVWQAVRVLGEARFLEVREVVRAFLQERESMEAVTAEELARRLQEGRVVVLDVRPPEEYQAGHIAGAMSIPVKELSRRLKELPRSKEIVAYCRGPYCVQSDKAVGLLARNGFKVRRLTVGLPDWRASGLPVEVTPASAASQPQRGALRTASRRTAKGRKRTPKPHP
jgi:rhodanese-related sulfurtransferase/biotin operon repressor